MDGSRKWGALILAALFALSGCHAANSSFALIPQSSPNFPESGSTASGIPMHVATAVYLYADGGTPTSYSIAQVAPYLTWANDVPSTYVTQAHNAGLKTFTYRNFWHNVTSDSPGIWYTDIAPGGLHAGAEAKDCSGAPVKDQTYGGGYLNDPHSSMALGHASVVISSRPTSGYDLVFSDEEDIGYVNRLPCDFALSTWISAQNNIHSQLDYSLIINDLAASDPISREPLTDPTNVKADMCEACFVHHYSGQPLKVDASPYWEKLVQAEIDLVAKHKIFWAYEKPLTDPASAQSVRLYGYASWLLSYDPNYTVFEEAFSTAYTQFPVMPETQLVPLSPTSTASSVSGYLQSNVYVRQWSQCYYRGSFIGSCAVVINPSPSATYSVPVHYTHALVVSGEDVLHGGSASFSGAPPASLAPLTATILSGGSAPSPSPSPSPTTTFSEAGKLVSKVSSTKFEFEFGSHCGYLYVYTNSRTLMPGSLTVGSSYAVSGSGSCASSVTASTIR